MSHRISKRAGQRAVLAAAMTVFPAVLAQADVVNWTGSGSGGDGTSWLSPANWTDTTTSANTVPTTSGVTGSGDVAFFYDAGLSNSFLSVAANTSLGSITLGSASNTLSNSLAISGSPILLYGLNVSGNTVAVTRDETTIGNQSISNNIVLENTGTAAGADCFNINGPGGSLTLGGVVSSLGTGTTGLTKNGDGTLVLLGINTYTGVTAVNSGTLAIAKTTAVPAVGNIELGGTGSATITLDFTATSAVTNSIDVRNTGSSLPLTIGSLSSGGSTTPTISVNGNINLYHDVQLFSDIANVGLVQQGVAASGIVETAPAGFTSANVVKTGSGYWLAGGPSTYYGTTTVSDGILQTQNAATNPNSSAITTASYSAGAATITLNSVTGLTVGMALAGPGVPLATSTANSTIDTITAINTSTNVITLARGIDPSLTTPAASGTTLYFGTPNPLGLSTTPVQLGDSATTANGYSAAVMITSRQFSRPITVTNNPTTGVYYIATRGAGGYTGLVTLDQPATIVASTAAVGMIFTGNIVSGNGPMTLTLGSVTTGSFFGVNAASFNTVTGNNTTGANGSINYSGGVISDGSGKLTVVENAGTNTFLSGEIYTGNTIINGGTLRVSGLGAIVNSPIINLNGSSGSAALFSAATGTAAAPYVFSAGQTVMGVGIFTGTPASSTGVVKFNGTVQTGETNNTAGKSPATLTLNAGSILNGSLRMDLTGVNQSDELAFGVGGTGNSTANLGGTLTVTNPNGVTLAAGQSYQLLSYGSNAVNGTFNQLNLPTLPAATPPMVWNTSGLYSGGSISIAGAAVTWNNTGGTGDGMTWDGSSQNWNDGTGPATYSDGDVVTFNDSNNNNYTVNIAGTVTPGQVIVTTANTYTIGGGGNIAGAASLTKSGAGMLNLQNSGPNTFGPIILNQGTINAGPGTLGNGNVILINPTGTTGTSADAATLISNGSFGNTSALTINSNSATAIGTANMSSTSESIGSLAGNGVLMLSNPSGTTLTVGGNNAVSTFSGTIKDNGTGLGSIIKVGTGTLALSGANAYGGGTQLNGGVLSVASAGGLGTSGTITFGGGTLQYAAPNTTDYSSRISTAGSQSIVIDTNGQTVSYATVLNSSGGTFTKLGLGTLTLGGAGNFTDANIMVNGGGLTSTVVGGFGAGSFIATTNTTSATLGGETTNPVAPVVINSTRSFTSSTALGIFGVGATNTVTVNLNGATESLGSLASNTTGGGTGKLVLANASGTVLTFGNSTATTIGGVITDNATNKGSLIYVGTANVTFANTDTYGGGTTIDSGVVITNRAGSLGTGFITVNPAGAGNAVLSDGGGFSVANALTVNLSGAGGGPFGRVALSAVSTTVGSLAGSGQVIFATGGAQTLTVGGNNTSTGFSGIFTDNGTNKGVLVKVGTGTLTMSGSNTYYGSTNVNAGTLAFSGNSAFPAVSDLNISSGATAMATNHGANPFTVLQVNSLNNNGKVDLTNNAMSVHNSSIGVINAMVKSGYGTGNWQGSTGITSSAAAADSTHLTALGAILNDDGTGNPLYGSGPLGMFEGTTPSLDDVLVKDTYYGDTNLDGIVDGTDYSRLDAGFLSQGGATPLTGWFNGDLNYDGVINGSDYTLMDNAFNSQGAQIAASVASPDASIAAEIASGGSSVPEPASMALLGAAALALLGRRRQHNRM